MRIKFTKRVLVLAGAVFILALLIVQMVAYSILQAVKPYEETTELPEQDTFDYELPLDQENEFISQGLTVLKFYHTSNCLNCLDQKSMLEYLVNQFKGKFILERIKSNQTVDYPVLVISSARERDVSLNNATSSDIIDKLCDLMLQPPLEFRCAIRNV